MGKWGTYLLMAAVTSVIVSFVFNFLNYEDIGSSTIFPFLSILLGGIGVILLLIEMALTQTFTWQSFLFITSMGAILYGYSFQKLGLTNAKYLLLAGALGFAVWIMIPTKKKVD